MNWEFEYHSRIRSAQAAIYENVQSGDGIYTGGPSSPTHTLNALFDAIQEEKLTGIELHSHTIFGDLTLSKYQFTREQLKYHTFFSSEPDRIFMNGKKCSYMPIQYGQFTSYIETVRPEVCIVMMSPPDLDGYCNIGPAGFHPVALRCAKKIIVQISKHVPRVVGTSHRYHVSEIDAFVLFDDPMSIVPSVPPTDVDQRIADFILERVPDGACIQLGIGGVANAVGFGLHHKKHLGIHSELLTESIVELMEQGAVDNSCKKYRPGVSVIGFALGTERQYQYIDQNPDFLFAEFSEVINIRNIAANDHMISINSAISVDLTGQVCAESIGRQIYSGTGGQLDFVRGSVQSKGGASFIAIPSTVKTKQGVKSRIVMDLELGSIVTTPRTDVQHVVTEYGVATLQYCDVPERVRRMIAIAHPDYRDELSWSARRAGLLF